MPLARFSLYSQGEQIHIAPTAYDDEITLANIRNTAFEGGVFVISASVLTRKDSYPEDFELRDDLASAGEFLSTGGSAVAGPEGELLAGPLWKEEGILYADLDLVDSVKHGQTLDVTGHYARPDIFNLLLDTSPKRNLNVSSLRNDQPDSKSSA